MTETQAHSTRQLPDRSCDMVMKGGITSGVVYPLAIAQIARQFRLKNIGGTSAGAIAAAAAAAAELGRASGGFERLELLPKFLSDQSPDRKNTNLFTLFQPQPDTQALFAVATAALGGGWRGALRMLRATLWHFPLAALIGALPAIALVAFAAFEPTGLRIAVLTVAALPLLAAGMIVALVLAILRQFAAAVPNNFYGMCSGMPACRCGGKESPREAAGAPLTLWLTILLDQLAERNSLERPLLFRDLWGTDDPAGDRKINLEMMSTCVSHGRPYRLPFRDDEGLRENRFYFSEEEFRRLFPTEIVQWMLLNPRKPLDMSPAKLREETELRQALAQKGLRPMPAPGDLPVVVAVRMSLCFPILLSAVPLYDIEWRNDPQGQSPERCWFSDGGICSNFPLHFFDAPLPRRPTLSIDLVERPVGTVPADLVPDMVDRNSDGIREHWNRFDSVESIQGGQKVRGDKGGLGKLVGFALAMIDTMRNWTDNTQSRLPGFRDRIVRVPLTPDEGGLNLNMPPGLIEALTDRGKRSGDLLLDHFGIPPRHERMTWANHRWLRLRSLLASVEQMLKQIDNACAHPETGDTAYDDWLASDDDGPSYALKPGPSRDLALETIRDLRAIAAKLQAAHQIQGQPVTLAEGAPRPRPELRPRAQI